RSIATALHPRRRGQFVGPARCARPGHAGRRLAATGLRRAEGRRTASRAARFHRWHRPGYRQLAALALLAQAAGTAGAGTACGRPRRVSGPRALPRRPEATGEQGEWGTMPLLLRRLHASRGARGVAEAQPRLAQLLSPGGLLGIDAAVDLLADAIARGAHIVVVGDFDCDGATACATGVRGLRMLGATRVSHAVPNRQVHGYGLSPGLVDDLAALQPDMLVTVDHGIACHSGIAAAKARGWQVLVTDHHLAGPRLPAADAIVDPNRPGDMFPSKALAGVGVMFYLLLALRARLFANDP